MCETEQEEVAEVAMGTEEEPSEEISEPPGGGLWTRALGGYLQHRLGTEQNSPRPFASRKGVLEMFLPSQVSPK